MKYKVATQMGNQGFSHECNRVAAEIVWSGAIGDVIEAHISTTPGTHPTGAAGAADGGVRSRYAGLGPLAGRRFHASLQFLVRALQLARLLRFRHRPDRQLGHPYGRSGADRAAIGRAHQRRMRQRGRPEQHHLSQSRRGPAGFSGARRHAAGEGLLSRLLAARRSRRLPRARHGERDHSPARQQSHR